MGINQLGILILKCFLMVLQLHTRAIKKTKQAEEMRDTDLMMVLPTASIILASQNKLIFACMTGS